MNIYWDINSHVFVTSLTNFSQIQQFNWVLRDQVAVNVYLVTSSDSAQSYTQQEAPAGFSVKFTAKPSASLTGSAYVFAGTWTLNGSGASAYYSATVDLGGTDLVAAVEAASSHYLDLVAELTLQDASGNQRDSTQITLRVTEDVLRTTDSVPASLSPWWREYTNAAGRKCLRIMNTDGETLATFEPAGS